MSNPAYCKGCGKRLEVPAGYSRSKLRCAECGVFNELPKPARTTKGKPAKSEEAEDTRLAIPNDRTPMPEDEADTEVIPMKAEEPPPKPKPKPTAGPERELLIAGTEADDGNPYQVTGDIASKYCPECDKKITKVARVCVHCGFNYDTKQKKERTFEPVKEEWEAGYPFQKRLMIFVGMQVVNFLILISSLVANHSPFVSVTIIAFSVALQAFLAGTYQRLNLTRNQKGKVVLTTTWRYAFIPGPTETVKWKEHDEITITRENEFDPISWAFVFILLGYACLPGIAFWYFVVRPDKFTVALCKDHGSPTTPIFRTTNEERAKEVMRVVSDVSTLPVQK